MNNFHILDCTLRDGGYINNFMFGHQNIKSIVSRLTRANIDIVECGFLEDGEYDRESSMFSHVDQIEKILPKNRENTQYVAMTRYGYMEIDNLKEYDGKSIEGIRITFHEDEAEEAIEYCKQVKEKGYRVFVQPVGTTSYPDVLLLKLIDIVNEIQPYAFYIVDTLGLMKKNDLLRVFHLIDNNLNKDIVIGFHSHNNLQLSYSNSQELVDLHTRRTIIVDSSVYGMGRGAGNLNTELIAQHLNSVRDKDYTVDYILEIVDETINPLLKKYTWGYSVPYYLAAINNCHPNYATYLMNRKTLPVKSIGNILNNIVLNKREIYDAEYIAELYTQYQEHNIDDTEHFAHLMERVRDRNILVIAPGKSIENQLIDIQQHIKTDDSLVIAVNFDGDGLNADICFFSNDKRYQKFIESSYKDNPKHFDFILTSNIKSDLKCGVSWINYSSLLNSQPDVNDNATLMLLALLIKLEVKQVAIAGFDGYRVKTTNNYADQGMETSLEDEILYKMNNEISAVVNEYRGKIKLNFITPSLFD